MAEDVEPRRFSGQPDVAQDDIRPKFRDQREAGIDARGAADQLDVVPVGAGVPDAAAPAEDEAELEIDEDFLRRVREA